MALSNIFSINKNKKNPLANNPLATYGASLFPTFSTQNKSVAPQMSVAPQRSASTLPPTQNKSVAPIPASGMTSRYASNPTTYKAPTPQPIRQVQQPQPNATSSWMQTVDQSANRQKTFAEQQRDQQQNFIKQQYELANQQLGEALPAAQQQFNQFKGNTEASIADLIAGGERQKSQASDYYGDAQRQSAQTLRETQGQQQRTFANLGTLDSRGEGSFQEANTNAMSDFNRGTQQLLKAKADKLTEIDATVSAAERNARATITQEEGKLNELARNIQYAQANNNLQQAQELTAAYNETQQYIYDIEDSLAQTKYQFGLEQQKLQDELAKTQSFTPEFMAGGQPTNQAEYEFFIKNQKDLQSAYGDTNSASNQKAANIISQLQGTGTSGITGLMRFGVSDESRSAEGLLKQLSSELQLEEAKRLKGQGAMSDAERAILANSIAAFNLDKNGRPQVSDTRFKQILDELAAQFGGGQQSGGMNQNDPLGLGI